MVLRMAMFLALLGLAAAASASQAPKVQKQTMGFMHALTFHHQLRVCNAYAGEEPVHIFRGKDERLTGDNPLAYKSCRDFSPELKAGDRLDFKMGESKSSTGTFLISKLPDNDAVLLLIIQRHDPVGTAASFQSHVFANMNNAQLAVIDTFRGAGEDSQVQILDETKAAAANSTEAPRGEALPFSSVVEINRGQYQVKLADKAGVAKAGAELVALEKQSYVLLRTGLDSKNSPYPQELVVFPQSSALELKSAATGLYPARGWLLAVALAAISTMRL